MRRYILILAALCFFAVSCGGSEPNDDTSGDGAVENTAATNVDDDAAGTTLRVETVTSAEGASATPDTEAAPVITGTTEPAAPAPTEDSEIVTNLENLEFEGAGQLRVLLYEASEAQADNAVVSRGVSDGLTAVVVVDTPQAVKVMTQEEFDELGLTADETFDLAMAQTVTDQLNFEHIDAIRTFYSDDPDIDFYKTSMLLDLGALDLPFSQHGYLVAVPTRGGLLVEPLDPDTIVESSVFLAPVVIGMYSEGPNAISSDLYWWHDGQIDTIHTTGSTVEFPLGLQELAGM